MEITRAAARQIAAVEQPSSSGGSGSGGLGRSGSLPGSRAIEPPVVAPIGGGPGGRVRPAVGRPGDPGYQPRIITLPEGAFFQATAVISADRRYVRISVLPFFSSIGNVSTFNFATGDTGTSGGGGGNNPFGGGGFGGGGGGF
jgi:hypothetical protein